MNMFKGAILPTLPCVTSFVLFCYDLNVVSPPTPNSCVEILMSKGDGINKMRPLEMVRSRGWALLNGICVLIKEREPTGL